MASNQDQQRNNEEDDLDVNYINNIFEMTSREYGDYSQRGNNDEETENFDGSTHYSNRVHSLHRNKAFKSTDALESGLQARVGGTSVRTLGRNKNADCFDNIIEEHANLIVSKMEQDPALIEDSPTSDDLRRIALRDMPQCLTLKRCVRQKLQRSVNKTSRRKTIGCWKMMRYRISFSVSRLKHEIKNVLYFFELWYSSLKTIEGNFGSGVGSFFRYLRTIFLLNFFVSIVSIAFVVVPQILHTNEGNETSQQMHFSWHDLFTGAGYFTTTPLYYGFYTNNTLSFFLLPYSMPHAYLFTMVALFLVFLVFFSISASTAYKRSFIETEGGLKNIFGQKVFCGWDYSIATREAAELKSHSIYHELKELLFESMRMKKKKSFCELLFLRLKQLFIHILITCGLIGVGVFSWYFLDQGFEEKFSPVLTAVFINVMMEIVPIVLGWIVKFENYNSPRTSLFLTLIRTFVLGLIIVAVMFTFWLRNPDQECWGTTLGQEIYRLILFDFIISVIFSPFLELCTFAIFRCFDNTRHLNFDISRNTMHIIYNQTLLWVGLIFSPLLPVIVTIKLFITWYVKECILLKFCKPSTKTWRATRTMTWFLMITFSGLLLVIGLLGYILSSIPTTDCGPFRHYSYIYEMITVDLLNLKKNSMIFKFILLATKPGCIALVLIGICALIYYLRAKANAQRKLAAVYRKMLVWQSRDKEFLLQNIAYITNGKWHYRLQDGRKPDPTLSSPFAMVRNRSNQEPEHRGSFTHESFSTPSTSFMNRRSADLAIQINNEVYDDFNKKIT